MAVPPRRIGNTIVITRSYPVTVERVWEALTVSEKLAPWYGPYTGDPASGSVDVVMVAEDSHIPVTMRIDVCEPPSRLVVTGDGGMRIDLTLTRASAGTQVELAHPITDPDTVGQYGAGWEFYLDRLAASLTGQDVDAISFDEYYPYLDEKYKGLAH